MPSAVQNSGLIGLGSPRTVVVTPENASIYGFDKLGATINLDTGGIVDPFSGPADGFNRDARNTAIQQRALANPNPVFPGYSQIMSDPAARAFNERLLGDPQFAWDNLQTGFGRQVDGNNPFYSPAVPATTTNPITRPGTTTGTTTTTPTSSGVNPFSNTRPSGQATTTTTTATPPSGEAQASAPKVDTMGGSFGTTPAPMGNTFTTTSAFQPVQTRSSSEYAPGRQNVTNAMMRRFNANNWF